MNVRSVDLTGHVFGRLRVIARASRSPNSYAHRWLCSCECGGQRVIYGKALMRGAARSCGCLLRETTARRATTHGHARPGRVAREYRCWQGIRRRCENPRRKDYPRYGGAGIKMCARWRASFEAFLCDMGPCPKGASIDRIDPAGNYEPANCRWATAEQQANNKRDSCRLTLNGRTQTAAEWGREVGMSGLAIRKRLARGWSVERALSEPLRRTK